MWIRPTVPFDPRRAPVFYGWVILVVSTIGLLMSVPGQTVGVSVFTDSLLSATGLGRLEISNAYLAGTLLSGLSLPFAGSWLDRLGARAMAALATLLLGGVLLALSQIDAFTGSAGGLRALVVLALAFFALRFGGQGVLTMVSRTMLAKWFDRRRGLVSGIQGVFFGGWMGAAPLLFDAWIGRAGWRGAWSEMAIVIGVGMFALALVFFRDNPERCGLHMDGASAEDEAARVERGAFDLAVTRREALRTLPFWALTLALSTHALAVTAVTFHIVDLGALEGLSREESVALFLPMSLVSTSCGLLGGVLADRVSMRALVMAMMGAEVVAVVFAGHLASSFWIVAVALGIAGGLFGPIAAVGYARFFGRTHLGAINGAHASALVIGSALGPSTLAMSVEWTGSYRPSLYALAALPILVLALSIRLRR